MRLEIATALVVAAVVCIIPQRSMATTYDVVADFNDTGSQPQAGNPFTYGTEATLNGPFTLFSNFGNTNCTGGTCTSDGSVDDYYNALSFIGPTTAKVVAGTTLHFSDGLIVIPNNVLVVEPSSSPSRLFNVTRFTAPVTGLYDIAGSFSDLQMASVGVSILVDGSTDFISGFTGSSPHQPAIPFLLNDISLTQGAIIDFVIDSLGDQSYDIAGLQADITASPTPLPAALPLFATGVGIMGWFGRRRKRMVVIADRRWGFCDRMRQTRSDLIIPNCP
jgi:hypothetical protein